MNGSFYELLAAADEVMQASIKAGLVHPADIRWLRHRLERAWAAGEGVEVLADFLHGIAQRVSREANQ